MALPATLDGVELYIKIGDGGSPTEEFTHPCLINSDRGITFRATTNDIVVPDCSNPGDPAWRELVKDALSAGVTGGGVMDNNPDVIHAYDAWWKSKTPKNIQVWLGTVGFWAYAAQLTEWSLTGARGNKIEVALTIESDGEVAGFEVNS